jgi:hypothetical protein
MAEEKKIEEILNNYNTAKTAKMRVRYPVKKNKYNCQNCSKEQEKARNLRRLK